MNTTTFLYLKALLFTILYYSILNGMTLILFKIIDVDFFDSNNKIYLIDLIPVLLTLILTFFLFKKELIYNQRKHIKPIKLLYIIILVFLIRFLNDPIYRFFEAFNFIDIPKQVPQNSFNFNIQVFFLLKLILLVPILEEVFFRGIILKSFLNKKIAIPLSVFISSLLFALIHFNPISINYITIVTAFSFGIVASVIYIKYGLLYAIVFHILHNTLWYIIRENKSYYFGILEKLDFGLLYWAIILIAFLSILLIFKTLLKPRQINE